MYLNGPLSISILFVSDYHNLELFLSVSRQDPSIIVVCSRKYRINTELSTFTDRAVKMFDEIVAIGTNRG